MKTILIIGPAPTRIGGVSTHISRLVWMLRGEYSFDFIDEARGMVAGYYNFRGGNFLPYFKKIKHADIVHIHSAVFILRVFHILIAKFIFRKPVYVSIHHDLTVEGHINTTRRLLKYCNYAILDSQKIYDSVNDTNTKCIYRMMPAFLPPIEDKEIPLPESIINWISQVREDPKSVLMCSSSYSIGEYNGVDLYGNDMSLDAVKILNKKQKDRHFYLIMILHNSERNPDTLSNYQSIIKDELKDSVLLETKPLSFIRIMKASDVVLRPTNTDGDSITVREALYFGKAVVASDCAARPEGTFVFKTRDIKDYCDKILLSLDIKKDKENKVLFDYKAFYKECYENSCSIGE